MNLMTTNLIYSKVMCRVMLRGIDGDMSPTYFHQDDEVAAHICTPPVVDDGGGTATVFDDGCTDIVLATIDCNATANLQNPETAN